jgi:hypothetical protein
MTASGAGFHATKGGAGWGKNQRAHWNKARSNR